MKKPYSADIVLPLTAESNTIRHIHKLKAAKDIFEGSDVRAGSRCVVRAYTYTHAREYTVANSLIFLVHIEIGFDAPKRRVM